MKSGYYCYFDEIYVYTFILPCHKIYDELDGAVRKIEEFHILACELDVIYVTAVIINNRNLLLLDMNLAGTTLWFYWT